MLHKPISNYISDTTVTEREAILKIDLDRHKRKSTKKFTQYFLL